ncbi:hypothetical protein [Limnofasciculus baicalensis]|uniref:Uncharacterized protein n=1 Tax=Limnofasciculus baicalensis BBK-W-15 TaxID=2699891 RepID=A0AAE3KME1_9CYAN|nr:hypothetical protein [Limnofasciculus baicalensis]MCP2728731.1 hypothetical protein [Limnofasciculus baicalensis BBK-W-15]
MSRKIIDISIYLENDVVSDPDGYLPKITYFNHQNTFSQIQSFFPGLKKEDLPDSEAWAKDIGYCHIEKLHNLEILPSSGFMVSCFPVKIRRASAGWTRAVAIINE